MDFDKNKRFESVYSNKVRAGRRRTYFFDVRKTKGSDYYLTITESKKRFEGDGYERHKVFLYKEDFNRFVDGLMQTIDHVKTELMPEYDYDEYTRRHQQYEEENRLQEGNAQENNTGDVEIIPNDDVPTLEETETKEYNDFNADDEDLSW